MKSRFQKVLRIAVCAMLVAILAVTTLLATGCGRTDFAGSTVPVDVNLPKDTAANLKMGVLDDASEKTSAQAIIDAFNEVYPNIKITLDPISGNYTQGLLSRIKSGTVPDILYVGDDTISYFAEKKLLLNLDAHMDAAKFDTSLYYDSMIKLGQKNQNGSQYMMPRDYNKVVCYYNKDLLAEAGITKDNPLYPNDDWTYDEFLDLCEALKKSSLSSDIYPVDAMLAWPPVFNAFIRSYGGELMTVDGKPAFNTPEAKEGLSAMKTLLDKGYTINPMQKTEEIFNAEKAVMYFAVRPIMSNLQVAGINYDAVSFPFIGEKGYIGAGTSGYGIARSSKHPNEAWAFLAFMMSKDGQQAFSKTGNAVPVLKSLATDEDAIWNTIPDIQARFNHKAFIQFDERDTLKDYLNGVNVDLYAKIDSAMLNLLDNYMGWTVAAGDPDEVCAKVEKDINRILNSD